MNLNNFIRPVGSQLQQRFAENRRFIQVLWGPRQVGKTTLVQQLLEQYSFTHYYASADAPGLQSSTWIEAQWLRARGLLSQNKEVLLILDEIQKLKDWSSYVKQYWDEDTREKRNIKVVLLGSSPLLLSSGLSESLAGRFEVTPITHWSFTEMHAAFGFDLNQYIYFGAYPGAAALISDENRFRHYILDSLIETSLSRDVLLLTRIHKPALLRQLFDLGVRYSGQILSWQKMLGQLHDAGNTTTLAHYAELLKAAGLLAVLPKFYGDVARQRASSPKFQVLNTGLMSAINTLPFQAAYADRSYWGRLVESAVGTHLMTAAFQHDVKISYWREGIHEVDFVIDTGTRLIALEVKSGRDKNSQGLAVFKQRFARALCLVVGGNEAPLESFFAKPLPEWLGEWGV